MAGVMVACATKQDHQHMEAALKTEIAAVWAELKADIAAVRGESPRWSNESCCALPSSSIA